MSKQKLSLIAVVLVTVLLSLLTFAGSIANEYLSSTEDNSPVLGYAADDVESAVVSRVIDGDTIELSDGRTVRYIGIDTPEIKHPQKGKECFGSEASLKNEQLVLGKTVYLHKDISETDRYGRLLRYVWLDDTQMVNQVLVEEGFAYASSYPPDIAFQEQLIDAQAQAQANGVGLWSACEFTFEGVTDADDEKDVGSLVDDIDQEDGECMIKGNISENGKLYHLPSCSSYQRTVISPEKGEQWFCTEAEALEAGWQKAGSC